MSFFILLKISSAKSFPPKPKARPPAIAIIITNPENKILTKSIATPNCSNAINTAKIITAHLAIEANNIISLDDEEEDTNITEEEEREIKELAMSKNIFDIMTRSIAPSIEGHNSLKRTMALQLFGGVRSMKDDGTFRRGSILY